jgi:putative thioredoxin
MIDITLDNFQADLIDASAQQPVLLDIWAEWCGPCKQLGPVLEKLERDYDGRFLLAKLDADKVPQIAQQLSQMFGVRSIPFCVLFSGGQPVDGFVGAVPEAQIREFLDKHVPGEDELASAGEAEEAQDLLASGDADAALVKLQEALAVNPANDDARHDYVKLLISAGHLEEAGAALQPALVRIPVEMRFEALNQWRLALEAVLGDARQDWSVEQFDAKIAENKRDFDLRLAKSRVLLARGQLTEAMDELLEIIMRDKKWSEELPRKTYVAILELLSPAKPKAGAEAGGKAAGSIELTGKAAMVEDPAAALVSSYRRKLSMALN